METPTPIVDEVDGKPTPTLKTHTPTETTPEVEVKASEFRYMQINNHFYIHNTLLTVIVG